MEVINFSGDPSFYSKPFLSVEAIPLTESSYFLWKLSLLMGAISFSGNNSFERKSFFSVGDILLSFFFKWKLFISAIIY